MNTDFTFIIKGPYSENHLQMIDELKKYGKVINIDISGAYPNTGTTKYLHC